MKKIKTHDMKAYDVETVIVIRVIAENEDAARQKVAKELEQYGPTFIGCDLSFDQDISNED